MSRVRGFTLIELAVALTVAGLAMLVAARIVSGASDAARRIGFEASRMDRRANSRRWLSAALLSLDVGRPGAVPFDGGPRAVRFSAWLETPRGWFERQVVTVRLDSGAIVAATGDGATLPLIEGASGLAFDYLLVPGDASRWAPAWSSPVTAPIAVRLRWEERGSRRADTLLLLVKGRG